ncbi:MAG: sugar phosphate isomerase/epimerase family protein [Planctomycetota bacterium]|jgi:sugar phosphate isomerase/epimerase
MSKQNFEIKNDKIREQFENIKKSSPEKLEKRLNLSWSNWGFGMESLETSVKRLAGAGVNYIELHGNHYGDDLGYKADEVLKILGDNNVKAAGVCGMFSAENDLSSNSGRSRQAAVDYLKRTIKFTSEVGGSYILVVPGAVGRPGAYDESEYLRSSETLRIVADLFAEYKINAAIEPIRSAEVSFCHTVADAEKYINMVNHPAIQHINGDVYHMQSEESHIGEAIIAAGKRLVNLHMADSNRTALGDGALDLDTIIMALYVTGYNRDGCYVTPEPLGPGGDPYPAMFGQTPSEVLDKLVQQTAKYFREREEFLISG